MPSGSKNWLPVVSAPSSFNIFPTKNPPAPFPASTTICRPASGLLFSGTFDKSAFSTEKRVVAAVSSSSGARVIGAVSSSTSVTTGSSVGSNPVSLRIALASPAAYSVIRSKLLGLGDNPVPVARTSSASSFAARSRISLICAFSSPPSFVKNLIPFL